MKCKNCGAGLQTDDLYCGKCGQKSEPSKVRFIAMVSIFFYSLFNADSSLWRTVRKLWIPGLLTSEYFAGRRKAYFHPARLFFFSWVLFFAVFTLGDNVHLVGDGEEVVDLYEQYERKIEDRKLLLSMIEVKDILVREDAELAGRIEPVIISTSEFLGRGKKYGDVDSLKHFLETHRDSLNLFITDTEKPLNFALEDIVLLTDDEIFERYKIEGFFLRILVKQGLKLMRDTTGMVEYIIRGLSWMVLIIIPIMALVLYLLYIYRGHYYVEHLVFMLHTHSLLFISILAVKLLEVMTNEVWGFFFDSSVDFAWGYFLAGVMVFLYPVVGLRTYYRSSYAGVIGKSIVLVFAYLIAAIIGIVLAMSIRFFMF
nr:DUF3667 domain-containing protein [Saprospiraceae bacterium]